MCNFLGCRMIGNKLISILFLGIMPIITRILFKTKKPTIYWLYFHFIPNQITSYYQTSSWLWEAFLPTRTFFPLPLKYSYQAFKFPKCKNQISTTPNPWWQGFPKLGNSKSIRSLGCLSRMLVRSFHKLHYKIVKGSWKIIAKSITCLWWII